MTEQTTQPVVSQESPGKARINWVAVLVALASVVAFFTALDMGTSIAYGHEDTSGAIWAVARIWLGLMVAGSLFLIVFGLRRSRRGAE